MKLCFRGLKGDLNVCISSAFMYRMFSVWICIKFTEEIWYNSFAKANNSYKYAIMPIFVNLCDFVMMWKNSEWMVEERKKWSAGRWTNSVISFRYIELNLSRYLHLLFCDNFISLPDRCFVNPCQNGGTCFQADNISPYSCTCPQGFLGFNCQNPGMYVCIYVDAKA